MSIRKYIAYLKTIETGNITQAAAQLGYTQSAVSRMIADLEADWGIKLMTRSNSGVEISSEGLSVLPRLQAIYRDFEDLNFTVSELHGLTGGKVRVGAFSSIASGRLPQLLKSFRACYPHIQFELICGEYNQVADWLQRGRVDCGFLELPAGSGLETSFVLRDSLVAVVPLDHPLASAPFFPVERLYDLPYIGLKEERDYEIQRFLDGLPMRPNLCCEVSDDYAILSMVECGLGVSVIHELMVDPNRYQVAALPFEHPQLRDIGIAVRRDVPPTAAAGLFVEHVLAWSRRSGKEESR